MNSTLDRPLAGSITRRRTVILVLRVLLSVVLLLTILLADRLKYLAGGMLLLFCGVPYAGILLAHAGFHIVPIVRAPRARPLLWIIVILSHLLLVGGMVLQMDYDAKMLPHLGLSYVYRLFDGSAPGVWVTDPPAPPQIGNGGAIWNLYVLAPVFVSWPLLLFRRLYSNAK